MATCINCERPIKVNNTDPIELCSSCWDEEYGDALEDREKLCFYCGKPLRGRMFEQGYNDLVEIDVCVNSTCSEYMKNYGVNF